MHELNQYGNLGIATLMDGVALTSAWSAAAVTLVSGANMLELYCGFSTVGAATSYAVKVEQSLDKTHFYNLTGAVAGAMSTVTISKKAIKVDSTDANVIQLYPIATLWARVSAKTLGGAAGSFNVIMSKVRI